MQGRCIQAPEKSNLVEGEIYFLYPHGGLAYNVSRFPRLGSHFGTYQKSRFEVITEEWPPEPSKPLEPPMLEEDKVYEAELIWRKESYSSELGKYFIELLMVVMQISKIATFILIQSSKMQKVGIRFIGLQIYVSMALK